MVRPLARRSRLFNHCRLRRFFGAVGIVTCLSGNDGARRPARDAALQIRQQARDRVDCCRWHARHFDSAVRRIRRVRNPDGRIDWPVVYGRRPTRHSADRIVHPGDLRPDDAQPETWPRVGPSQAICRTDACPQKSIVDNRNNSRHHRRYLYGRILGGRGRRYWGVPRLFGHADSKISQSRIGD